MSLRRPPDPRRWVGGIGVRLTVSYALVVVAAAVALSVAATISALARGENQVARTSVTGVLEKNAAAAGSYPAGRASAGALRYLVAVPTLENLAGRSSRSVAVAVLDANTRLVAADSCTRAAHRASTPAACLSSALSLLRPLLDEPATKRLLDRAVHGTPTSGAAAGRAFAAVPVRMGGKQEGGGALVAAFAGAVPVTQGQSGLTRFWSQWKASLPHGWLWLAGLTILLGTAAGALLSHRHVRRVTEIATVARRWSRGDLSATADASRSDELGRLARDLNRMAEQIRNLLDTRSQLATQQERRRVQRDLHDGIKQELFATSMQLAAARASLPPDAQAVAAAIDQAQASNQRAQTELATLLEQAPALRGNELEAAVGELVDRVANDGSLQASRDIRIDAPPSPATAEAMYRVAREALANVHRHARAAHITVTLTSNLNETRLQIRDDGRGFQPEEPAPGMGLRTMRERVEALGGHLAIESHDTGTTVTATITPTAA